jgi:Mlc titration factor MtfA (ptsG expression regulator)
MCSTVDAADVPTVLPMLGLVVLVLGGAAALLAQPRWAEHRRQRLRRRPLPAEWAAIVQRRVPLAARLPAPLRRRLDGHIQVFVAEKPFIGCQGQLIDDDVRITVAAQASLLLLGHDQPACYPRLRQVLVYPDAFVVQRTRTLQGGVVDVQRQALSGESWGQGQVILAWQQVLDGAADGGDGRNVVLHEFAHQIDQDSGAADGRPFLPDASAHRRWSAVMGAAFERLQHTPSAVLDAYGASDPAEFFAVATEVFFERPRALAEEAPQVFDELARLYRLDPRSWSTADAQPLAQARQE